MYLWRAPPPYWGKNWRLVWSSRLSVLAEQGYEGLDGLKLSRRLIKCPGIVGRCRYTALTIQGV